MDTFNVLEGLSFTYEGDPIVAYKPLHDFEFRLAVVGSRDFEDLWKVDELVVRLPRMITIVSGGAKGVDSRAIEVAKRVGVRFQEWKPQYQFYSYTEAPLRRNEQIARMCHAMVAFWDGESRGTKHAMRCARDLRKPVAIIR